MATDGLIGMNLNRMRIGISQWQAGRSDRFKYVPGYDSSDLITLLRQVLVDCPDEFPSSGTAELSFIGDQALRENLRIDISAMNRALSDGGWKAATVLAGSIVEALLLWALQQQDPAKRETAITTASKKALHQKPPTNLEKWILHQLIEVAAEGDVICADTTSLARLAKDFRNLIHPGRALRLERVCDRGTALSAVAAVEHVVRDLVSR